MDILYLLIPLSALLVLLILALFGWALHKDQFEDLDQEGVRILQHDDAPVQPVDPTLDLTQAGAGPGPEESHPSHPSNRTMFDRQP